MRKSDLFKGKPKPVLPKIKGLPLPEDEGEFFDEITDEDIELPEASKLKIEDLKTREEDPKFRTKQSDSLERIKIKIR